MVVGEVQKIIYVEGQTANQDNIIKPGITVSSQILLSWETEIGQNTAPEISQ